MHRKLLWKLELNCAISLVVYRLFVCVWKMGFKLIAEKATRVHALKIHKESNPPQQLLNATIESVAMITALTGSVYAHCAFINENNNKNKYHQQYIGRVIDRQTKRAKLYTLLYCTAPLFPQTFAQMECPFLFCFCKLRITSVLICVFHSVLIFELYISTNTPHI